MQPARARVTYSTDVAVVGAGTAGAAVAAFAAARGLSVVVVDAKPLGEAGARWVNGVAGWMFDAAGVPRPEGPELLAAGGAFHLIAGYDGPRVTVRDSALLDVDMRLLVARLQRMATAAGATLLGETRVTGFDGAVLATTAGGIAARTFVDASGLAGARLLGAPAPPRRAICAAAQEVRHVRDRDAARAFFEAHGASSDDTLVFTGVAGGYSIVNVRLHDDGARVGVLTGSIPADGHASGRALLDRFVAEHPWIGALDFGGARAIPVGPRFSVDRFARGNVAAVGDAAGQVYAAHGSGIGAGMIAARLLVDTLAAGKAPVHYARTWRARFSATFREQDVLRRAAQAMSLRQIGWLMATGLVDERAVRAGLLGERHRPPLGKLARAVRVGVGARSLSAASP